MLAQTTKRITRNMRAINWSHEKNKWSHLNGINFPSLGKRPTIDMLIGLDLSDLLCSLKEVRGNPGEPIARLMPQQNSGSEVNHMSFLITEERQLDSLIKPIWEIEEPSRVHSFVLKMFKLNKPSWPVSNKLQMDIW